MSPRHQDVVWCETKEPMGQGHRPLAPAMSICWSDGKVRREGGIGREEAGKSIQRGWWWLVPNRYVSYAVATVLSGNAHICTAPYNDQTTNPPGLAYQTQGSQAPTLGPNYVKAGSQNHMLRLPLTGSHRDTPAHMQLLERKGWGQPHPHCGNRPDFCRRAAHRVRSLTIPPPPSPPGELGCGKSGGGPQKWHGNSRGERGGKPQCGTHMTHDQQQVPV